MSSSSLPATTLPTRWTPPSAAATLEVDARHLAVEVTTDGAQGVLVATGTQADGRPGYDQEAYERSRNRAADYPQDGVLDAAELDSITAHVRVLIERLEGGGPPLRGRYLVLSPEYEAREEMSDTLRARLAAAFPDLRVERLTPELEARANYFTMAGRTDMDFRDFVLADIGAAGTSISVYEYPTEDLPSVHHLPYGSRTTVEAVDPLGELRIRRPRQQLRLQQLVEDLTALPIKKIMRRPEFARRGKVVFMGGLVYKIVRILDIPLTGRAIDFSPKSEADLPARFKAMLVNPDADLSPGPDYSPEAIYAALTLLETLMEEAGERESIYFFERSTWLPGYALARESTGLNR